MDARIIAAQQALKEAQATLDAVVADVQAHCKHGYVGECDYQPSDFFTSSPPKRVCLDCGVTEEGWGIGFVVLTPSRVFKITRDELHRERIGKFYDEDAKCEFKGYRQKAA